MYSIIIAVDISNRKACIVYIAFCDDMIFFSLLYTKMRNFNVYSS